MMESTFQLKLPVPSRRARSLAAAALAVVVGLLSSPAGAQQPPRTGRTDMTVVTSPVEALVTLTGSSEVTSTSPLELEPQWTGKYLVKVEAPGYATARGVLYFPERGLRPSARSEPPGLTPGLLLRSLNFPGVPHLLDHRTARGTAFLVAGAGGLGAVVRDQIEYRDNFDKTDFESEDRAAGFRYARGRWMIYTGSVWGLSALDYIVRARMDLLESTPTQVTVGAPKLTRLGVVWRSILVPGAGQDYANRKIRGVAWLGAILASGAAYFIADESHNRILIKLTRAEALLATAPPSEIPDRQADVEHFTSLEDRSRRLVDGLAIGTAGVYVANILDAGVIPLGGGSSTTKKFSLVAPVHPRRAAIGLAYRF